MQGTLKVQLTYITPHLTKKVFEPWGIQCVLDLRQTII